MLFNFLLQLTAKERTHRSNRQFGGIPAFTAGVIYGDVFSMVQRDTSHLTGVITDQGLELGRLSDGNPSKKTSGIQFVKANIDKLFIHIPLLGLLFSSGIAGAFAFKARGLNATLSIALVQLARASPASVPDLRSAAMWL